MDDVRRTVVDRAAVRECERGLAVLVDGLDANDVPLCEASGLWKAFDCIERLAANAKLLLAARVEEAGAWREAGARSAAEHLAKLGGTTTSAARRSLETSKQVAGLFQMTDALRGGVFSTAQANAIAGAAAADPAAENRLIALAASTNVAELRKSVCGPPQRQIRIATRGMGGSMRGAVCGGSPTGKGPGTSPRGVFPIGWA